LKRIFVSCNYFYISPISPANAVGHGDVFSAQAWWVMPANNVNLWSTTMAMKQRGN